MFERVIAQSQAWIEAHPKFVRYSVGGTALVLTALLAIPSQASTPWKWRDLSQQIPSSVQTAITMVAGRGTDWLASDGGHLWSVNPKEEVTAYNDYVRQYGQVQTIGSNGREYLLAFRGSSGPSFVKTNLKQWTTVSELRFPQRTVRSIEGDAAGWAVITDDQQESSSLPKTWQISWWQDGQATTNALTLPSQVSAFVPGCFKSSSSVGSSVCAGSVAFVPLNGSWYLFAGEAETRGQDTKVLQQGRAGIWRWDGLTFTRVASAPKARFISGVWASGNNILFATSDAVTNPYAADTYWTFNGSSFKSYKNQPLEAGMLSVDTRSVRAAWTGSSWAIVAGKTLVQIKNGSFAVEGDLRDQVMDIAGSTSANALLVGKRGVFESTGTASTSSLPMLALLGETFSTDDANYLIQPRIGTTKRTELTQITVTGNPSPATISNGESFTVRADASADIGIKQIDIIVNDARIISCPSSPCRYTQTYWTNSDEKRRVLFTARATDMEGHVTESLALVLTVQNAPVSGSVVQATNDSVLMPAGLHWTTDPSSGIAYTTWLVPSSTSAALDQTNVRTVHVAGMGAGGIERIEFWVNGKMTRECTDGEQSGIWFCEVRVVRSDYPAIGDVLVNARLMAKDGKEAWSQVMRIGQ